MVEFLIGIGILGCIYGTAAISLNLQAGVTGLLNFGQVAFIGMGAYAVALSARQGWPWPVGFTMGVAVAAGAGFAIGLLGRTLASHYWAIVTLALAELVRLVALNEDGLTGGAQGLSGVPTMWPQLEGTTARVAILLTGLAIVGVAYVIAAHVIRNQFGRVLRLIRENEDLAASLDHNVVWAKARVMALSGGIAAVAGGYLAMYLSFVGPTQLLPFETFLIFTMIVVGGLGNAHGAALGAFLVAFLYDGARFIGDVTPLSADEVAAIRILTVGGVLLGFLLVRTQGLVPEKMREFHARG